MPSQPQSLQSALVLGVDLGGTKLRVGLAGQSGQLLTENVDPTDSDGGAAVCAQIGNLARNACRQAGVAGTAIGIAVIGAPGVFNPRTGAISLCPNIAGFDTMDVHAALEAELGVPVLIRNDVKIAALGEMCVGVAKGVRDFVFLSLGTGVAMGLVINGTLVNGAHDAAGEIGYLSNVSDSARSLEDCIGAVGLASAYQNAGGARDVSVRSIFERARSGETAAQMTLDHLVCHAAEAILTVAWIVDPAMVVLGGSMGMQPELAAQLRVYLETRFLAPIRLEISKLENRAGVWGAVALGREVIAAGDVSQGQKMYHVG